MENKQKNYPTLPEEQSAISMYESLMEDVPANDKHPANPSPFTAETKALYAFAVLRLSGQVKKDCMGKEHAALMYAYQTYMLADNLVNKDHDETMTNQLLVVSLLVALEECYYATSCWSYGSRLLYELKAAGIPLKRPQISAFLAQEGTWDSNRNKSDLLDGNAIAVGIYCARLNAICYSLTGRSMRAGGTEEMLEKIEGTEAAETAEAIFDFYLKSFAVPYLESKGCQDAQQKVAAFQTWLARSDFYRAPCSTKFHLSRGGGLQEHTANVLMQLLRLTLPANKLEIGACVLAAIGHDLCKVGVYNQQTKSKKFYLEEGAEAPEGAQVKTDQGGRFYWGNDFYYEFRDAMPFGHGRKSAYMLQGFFPEIGEDVFAAVDGHMGDATANKQYMLQFAQFPMVLNLHIADVMATYLIESGL